MTEEKLLQLKQNRREKEEFKKILEFLEITSSIELKEHLSDGLGNKKFTICLSPYISVVGNAIKNGLIQEIERLDKEFKEL